MKTYLKLQYQVKRRCISKFKKLFNQLVTQRFDTGGKTRKSEEEMDAVLNYSFLNTLQQDEYHLDGGQDGPDDLRGLGEKSYVSVPKSCQLLTQL